MSKGEFLRFCLRTSAINDNSEEEVSVGRTFSDDMKGEMPRQIVTICRVKNQGRFLNKSYQSSTGRKIYQYSFLPKASEKLSLAESIIGKLLCSC